MVNKKSGKKSTRITIRKVYLGSKKYTGGRPDFYVVTNHLGEKISVGTKEEAEEIAAASRRIREKRKKW